MQSHKNIVTPSGDQAEKQFLAFDFQSFLLAFIIYNQTEVSNLIQSLMRSLDDWKDHGISGGWFLVWRLPYQQLETSTLESGTLSFSLCASWFFLHPEKSDLNRWPSITDIYLLPAVYSAKLSLREMNVYECKIAFIYI